jgi:hypothetical protein
MIPTDVVFGISFFVDEVTAFGSKPKFNRISNSLIVSVTITPVLYRYVEFGRLECNLNNNNEAYIRSL